jgi:hypothetical protein
MLCGVWLPTVCSFAIKQCLDEESLDVYVHLCPSLVFPLYRFNTEDDLFFLFHSFIVSFAPR